MSTGRPARDDDEEDDRSFLQKHLTTIIVAVVVLVGIGFGIKLMGGKKKEGPKRENFTLVALPPPPPPPKPTPPPPPPPPQPEQQQQPEEKMTENIPTENPDPKPAEPEAPKADEPMGTGIKGDGPDSFGLGGGRGTGFNNLGRGGGGKGGSKYGIYFNQVGRQFADALRQNPKTRAAKIANLQVRVYPDSSGRVTRVMLTKSTGDAELDKAIQEVASSHRFEAPPSGVGSMELRVNARRP